MLNNVVDRNKFIPITCSLSLSLANGLWLIKVLYTRMILFALPIECPLILDIFDVILIEKVLINNLTLGK